MERFYLGVAMHQTGRDQLRYGLLAIAAILIAAPGVHLFELWLDHRVAFWVSHGLAFGALALVAWRWWATRAQAAPSDGPAA